VLLLGSPAAGAHRVVGTGLALLAAAGLAALSLDRRDALPGPDRVAATGLGCGAPTEVLGQRPRTLFHRRIPRSR
ncbi:MAG: protein of unknown function transrane, partial [Amycolatopsis sp.]|uniref:hypothetical protein n=1 Tax=Amycolatopsis sp. TaxID=37632 RepID=UPI002628E47E